MSARTYPCNKCKKNLASKSERARHVNKCKEGSEVVSSPAKEPQNYVPESKVAGKKKPATKIRGDFNLFAVLDSDVSA
mgnify:CR=1 FL=1